MSWSRVLKLTERDREQLLAALPECPLRSRIFNLRNLTESTAGRYEFRGLECSVCNAVTAHYKPHKSNDAFACDDCGTVG